MSRATEGELSALHGQLAKALAEAIKPEPVVVTKDGEATLVGYKVNAAALNVARQWLKDQGISVLPSSPQAAAVKEAIEGLPDFAPEPDLYDETPSKA